MTSFASTGMPGLNRRRLLGSGLALGAAGVVGHAVLGRGTEAVATTTATSAGNTPPTVDSLTSTYPSTSHTAAADGTGRR